MRITDFFLSMYQNKDKIGHYLLDNFVTLSYFSMERNELLL